MSETTDACQIVWFRRDLRVQDNAALAAALANGIPVIPVYIHAPSEDAPWEAGGASHWWLHHALISLKSELQKAGLKLVIRQGNSLEELKKICEDSNASHVFWSRRYEPNVMQRDQQIKRALIDLGIEARSCNSSLIWEPHTVENKAGKPFRVFTPFWKHVRTLPTRPPIAVDTSQLRATDYQPGSLDISDLDLTPSIPWDEEFSEHWNPTLEGAAQRLAKFAEEGVNHYQQQRDIPGKDGTSALSPYLASGQLGPRQIWQAIMQSDHADGQGGYKFLSEIAWREFAYHLLYHFPETPAKALNQGYADFPWEPDDNLLTAWQQGQTGYPIVDAGMRQLWKSGWMHNRVRMVAASLLVKQLLQPWQEGARWFWDTLVDADLASNTMGWQWTAGCGADAAPYFRIFNPILQGEKFDPEGDYVRRWVPELAKLPNRYLHKPWEAPASVLQQAGVVLGSSYPHPAVDHRRGRERALQALAANKQINQARDA